jgi:2-keto-3-deoxy-L-rhamnonate aldolase RhmA
MSLNNLEKFKAKIANKQICLGTCISLSDSVVCELFADAGYDFLWIDAEHGPLDVRTVLSHVMAVRGTDCAPFVRVPWNDPVLIKPILEFEPAGIIVPFIRNADEAKRAVAACKYPPKGIRGFGPRRGVKFGGVDTLTYLKDADQRTMVIIQIEHIDAVNNIDAILAVDGIDAVALGPNDLSGSIGLLGQTEHPEVVKMIDLVIRKVRQANLPMGVATGYNPQKVRQWVEKGIQWMALNNDTSNLFIQAKMIHDDVRSIRMSS